MRLADIREVVDATRTALSEERVAQLIRRASGRPPTELVPPERMELRETWLRDRTSPPSAVDFERILGTNDLLDVNFLDKARRASNAVFRVVLRDRFGREVGYGTGFMVSPTLGITNHHVLPSPSAADSAVIEFNYELEVSGQPRPTARYELAAEAFFFANRDLDFALFAVRPVPIFGEAVLETAGFLPLIGEVGKINPGEFMTLIQHPGGQPKQIALRENELLDIQPNVLWYRSDTAPGSSGSPVLSDSLEVVALHHSGVPRTNSHGQWLLKDGTPAAADADDSDIDWIANEGIRASRIVRLVREAADDGPLKSEFLDAPTLAGREVAPLPSRPSPTGWRTVSSDGRITVDIPLSVAVSMEVGGAPGSTPPVADRTLAEPSVAPPLAAPERLREPIVDGDYSNRRGYDETFLSRRVRMPRPRYPSQAVKMQDGRLVLPYEHFSVVMHRDRRMALITASNVDAAPSKKRPESGFDYTRDGLGGFRKNDREKWVLDPRIPTGCQLPDRFFTEDRGSFDKGHIVRRDDVTWGTSYAQVQRANGDTYHVTNCSPQVADFNRSGLKGIWGQLENTVLRQAKNEKLCVFSGPVFRDDDPQFSGRDLDGRTNVQIPGAYWKVVVAEGEEGLESFAFVLHQDLDDVNFEFSVSRRWRAFMVSIEALQADIDVRFHQEVHRADQFGRRPARELMSSTETAGLSVAAKCPPEEIQCDVTAAFPPGALFTAYIESRASGSRHDLNLAGGRDRLCLEAGDYTLVWAIVAPPGSEYTVALAAPSSATWSANLGPIVDETDSGQRDFRVDP